MLRAHSLLWHYLWLGPDLLQIGLAFFLVRRGLHRSFPGFFTYTIFEALETFVLYAFDLLPQVSAEMWWKAFWAGLVIGGIIRIVVIVELFQSLVRGRPTLAESGKKLFFSTGVALVLVGLAVAAYTNPVNPHRIIGYGLIVQQTLYIIDCGLILFVFAFAAHFRLAWTRATFGIALGFSVVFCEHLASRSVIAAIAIPQRGDLLLSFLNMVTYHLCVLIWGYFLLVPQKRATTSGVSLPETDLAAWNRELERLLQQ